MKYQQYGFFLVIVLLIIILYRQTPLFFFQQDEWLAFGRHITLKREGLSAVLVEAFSPTVGHYNPLKFLTINFLFSVFGLNYKAYALTSVFLHIVSAFLVLQVVRIATKSLYLALLAAFLFGIMAAGSQATTWVVADISTHGATILGILSVVSFFSFLQTTNDKFFRTSVILLILSLLFKEITIGLFLLLPLAFYLFSNGSLRKKHKYPVSILVVGGIYLALRVSMFFLPNSQQAESLVTQTQSLQQIFLNLLILPINSVAQSLVPVNLLLSIAREIASRLPTEFVGERFTPEYDLFIQQTVLGALSGLIFLGTLVLAIFTWWKYKGKMLAKVIVFALAWIVLNSFLFALSPERRGLMSIVESRNLYFVSVGTVLLIVSLTTTLFSKRFAFGVLMLTFVLNALFLSQETSVLAKNGTLRRGMLEQIQTDFPNLPEKAILYTESDSAFYGLSPSERVLPFQSGFGQTLLVWYYSTANFPVEFFKDRFLWDIKEEGYKELGNRGFGYFRNFNLLAQTVKEKDIPLSSVFSFRYNSEDQTLTNNTQEVSGRLTGYLADKKEVDPRFFITTPSINSKDTMLMFDSKRETFWNSEVPYAVPQTVDIDFKTQREIAQIRIDSYNNKDQNEIGYEISISQNGKDWGEVFYAKRYPPGDDGYVDLFFEPQVARFVRIRQIGFHQYAGWVIHEMRIYEKAD
ncbi:MAG: discoidin domain-containing protein [bacterium]|nr:discoidin domain-containing protein [bacterium]